MSTITLPTLAVSCRTLNLLNKLYFYLAASSDKGRPVCECDRHLMSSLYFANPTHTNYDDSQCVKNLIPSSTKAECCLWDTFMHASYNPDKQCCGSTGVKKISEGQC